MNNLEERVAELEKQVAELQAELAPYRRLGPKPGDYKPDPEVVNRLVDAARAAIRDAQPANSEE